MNLIKIDGYRYASPDLNKILHYWLREKKKYFESKELVYIAEVDDTSIGVSTEIFKEHYGEPGRSDWYEIEDPKIIDLITSKCPASKDQIMAVGLLELNESRFAPHIDPSDARTHCINYILNVGGQNVETVWYDIKPEHRHRKIECAPIPNERLTETERHLLKPETWYQLKTDVPHSVENIESIRLSISIALHEPIV